MIQAAASPNFPCSECDSNGSLPLYFALQAIEQSLDIIKIIAEVHPAGIFSKFRTELMDEMPSGIRFSYEHSASTVCDVLLNTVISYLHSTLPSGVEEVEEFFTCHFDMDDVAHMVNEFPFVEILSAVVKKAIFWPCTLLLCMDLLLKTCKRL